MVCSKLRELCNQHHNPIVEHVHRPERFLMSLSVNSSPPPPPGSHYSAFCPCRFVCSRHFYKRTHIICNSLCASSSLTSHNVCEAHPSCSTSHFWGVLHCRNVQHFVEKKMYFEKKLFGPGIDVLGVQRKCGTWCLLWRFLKVNERGKMKPCGIVKENGRVWVVMDAN